VLSAEIPAGEEQRGSFATAAGQFGVSASPDAPELEVRIHSPIVQTIGSSAS